MSRQTDGHENEKPVELGCDQSCSNLTEKAEIGIVAATVVESIPFQGLSLQVGEIRA